MHPLLFFFRTRLLTLVALSLTVMGSFSCKSEMNQPSVSGAKTYLALGDSYTIGEAVPEADRWGVQLAVLLRQEDIPVSSPRIIARTGWTTAELIKAIDLEQVRDTYDLVSLLIGVNNQYRGQSLDQYRSEFRQLLQTATRLAKGKPQNVLVLSIPDWGVTPFAADRDRAQIGREIDQFNAVAVEEAQKAGAFFVDVTPVSRTAATMPGFVASDRLHFSGAMYQEWARLALPVARKILRD
ncbi:SGNH/GDSL hydrolase family protein [soil metagenome]|jgi:lysophospholipase L1-like esterase